MIVVMKPGAPRKDTRTVIGKIRELGYTPHTIYGKTRNVIGAIGDERGKFVLHSLESLPGVERVVPILKPYKLASREVKPEPTEIRLAPGVSVGGKKLLVIAGPCSVESEQQMVETANAVKAAGAHVLRGGAFKPRTSPYAFQGLEERGLKILRKAGDRAGMPVVTEVMNPMDVDLVARYSDILQVGARNVQNFSLLKRIGKSKRPILLKRGMMTTITEFLMSAEYCLSEGSRQVILCERGIRTFEDATRNTLDLSAVPVLKERTHLPIIVDPSHGTGHSQYVKPMSCASVAAGADGLMIEVHPTPEKALSDGPQSLTFEKFAELMAVLKPFVAAAGRTI
ncbi:MAG: 3-deoxy-7-phosphoheptulonate synthase, 3-deoxy-7-phosphoheptulonate synthase [Deltaproteobacteria bacterium CSP1-8]|nr:MAG: 3-deoxy-7-phosphoheptulonate synthase, 3-deoxy-7-phosphoheptulonate synthase [Deltaproteobacteria bacterium CSP1-8]